MMKLNTNMRVNDNAPDTTPVASSPDTSTPASGSPSGVRRRRGIVLAAALTAAILNVVGGFAGPASAATDETTDTEQTEPRATTPASWFLIISGIGGEAHYSRRFLRWSQSFTELISQYKYVEDIHVHRLAESVDPAKDSQEGEQDEPSEQSSQNESAQEQSPGIEAGARQSLTSIDGESTQDNIQNRLDTIAESAADGDTVFIVFIGHGSNDAGRALFNIPGPDISSQQLQQQLAAFEKQNVVMINTTSSSSPFLQTLAAEGRIVITATSNPAENQHTYFGQYFIQALASDDADSDKDKRISVLEAFTYATRETERHYEEKGAIATEHALLDDDGDGIGSTKPAVAPVDSLNLDGAQAAATFLHAGPKTGERITEQSLSYDIAARGLVDEIETLKRQRDRLTEQDYDSQLEDLLVTLAQNRRDLRLELEAAAGD